MKSLSHVWLLATPWTAAYQAPPSMGFSKQEYWSGVPLPSPLLPEGYPLIYYLGPSPKENIVLIVFILNKIKVENYFFQHLILYFETTYLFIVIPHSLWDLLHQGLNLNPQQWKHGVLTTRPPGNSQYFLTLTERTQVIIRMKYWKVKLLFSNYHILFSFFL